MSIATTEMTWTQFLEEGKKRFGPDKNDWRFVCPACGHVQSVTEFLKRHPDSKPKDAIPWIFFDCEGRVDRSVGCNWTLGGLIHIQERMLTETGTETDKCPAFLFDGEQGESKPFYTPREKPAVKDHPHDR